MILRETYQVDSLEIHAMAKSSIDPARFLHDQLESASPDLLRLIVAYLNLACAPRPGTDKPCSMTKLRSCKQRSRSKRNK